MTSHIFIYILNPQTIISMFRCHPYRFYTWSQTAGSSWIMHFILSAYNDTTVILVCWHTTPIHFHIRKLERRALHQVWRWFCYWSHFGLGRRWGGKKHNPRCRRRCCCWCCRVINISLSSHIIRVHFGKFHFKFYEGCRKKTNEVC